MIEESIEEEEYAVEFIIGARRVRAKAVYRVKWLGYPDSENCESDVPAPSEYLFKNGHEMEEKKIQVT